MLLAVVATVFYLVVGQGQTDLDSPILKVLGESHRSVLGREAVLEGVTYGSDLRLFTNHAKIPAVLYGHGNDPVHVTLPGHDTMMALKHGGANALLERVHVRVGAEEIRDVLAAA